VSEVVAIEAAPRTASVIRDYLELSKPRIVMMVVITAAAGFLVGSQSIDFILLLHTLIGTALVAGGTNALNQYAEREHDSRMNRTKSRPLPDGRMTPRAALVFSSGIALIGTLYLGLAVNWLSAALGAFTLVTYIFLYTPLKRVSTICTLVGAIPGAVPPLMGWAAVRGNLALEGWVLFGILFLWQMPHFLAISWMYREDYGRAGFVMTAVRDENGRNTAVQAFLYTLALIGVSVAPVFLGMTGPIYAIGALSAGAFFAFASLRFMLDHSRIVARKMFMVSNFYLLTVMILLVVSARG
jgi:protoheme IX farnesyltransferase